MSQTTVERYMNERLVTININSTAKDIAKLMDKTNVSSVLITDDGNKIIGIFTERDIVRIISRDLQPDRIIAVSPPLVYVDADASMEQASETMLKNKVRHLLVRDPTSKEIVGIMTNTDFVKYLRNQSVSKGIESILEAATIEMLNY
jgi:CBS domain-containing protein